MLSLGLKNMIVHKYSIDGWWYSVAIDAMHLTCPTLIYDKGTSVSLGML